MEKINSVKVVGNNNFRTSLFLINDTLALIAICAVIAFDNSSVITWSAQILFYIVTFINSYLLGRKINLFCLWIILFYSFCLLSGIWAFSAIGASVISTTLIKMTLTLTFLTLYINGNREINIVLKSYVAGAAISLFKLIIYTPFAEWGTERIGGSIQMNANTLGLLFVCASTICFYYSKKNKIYFLGFLIFGVFSLFSGSRKAFVLLIMMIAMFFFNKIKKPLNLLIYIVPFCALIAGIIMVSINNPVLYSILGKRIEGLLNVVTGKGKIDASTVIRLDLISIGIEQFKQKWLIGYGSYSFRYMNKYNLYAHNNYIELIVNHGIIGAILYYVMPITLLIKGIIIWSTKTRKVILAIIFLITMLVQDYGMVSYYSISPMILLVVSYKIIVTFDKDFKKVD